MVALGRTGGPAGTSGKKSPGGSSDSPTACDDKLPLAEAAGATGPTDCSACGKAGIGSPVEMLAPGSHWLRCFTATLG